MRGKLSKLATLNISSTLIPGRMVHHRWSGALRLWANYLIHTDHGIAADRSDGTGPFRAWPLKRDVTPHVPVRERKDQTRGKYDVSHFQYDPDRGSIACFGGRTNPAQRRRRYTIKRHRSEATTCGACPIRKASLWTANPRAVNLYCGRAAKTGSPRRETAARSRRRPAAVQREICRCPTG